MGVNFDHGPSKAPRAALTARSISSGPPSAIWVITFPVDGAILSKVFPDSESTHSLLIRSFFGSEADAGGGTRESTAVAILITPFVSSGLSYRAVCGKRQSRE